MLAPNIDPVIFSIGPYVQIRWYGLMYVVGFVIAGILLRQLVSQGFFQVKKEKVDSLITHVLLCMFVGSRFTYVFVYNWDYYSRHLMEVLAVWKGGLSFHGALAGIIFGAYLFAKKNKIPLLQVMDSIALAGAQGLFWGRMGNFINHELYGRKTDFFLGMIFKNAGPYPRHPSQLYEGVAEGIVLSIILWLMFRRVKRYGIIGSFFIIGYGVFRFGIEFVREADSQLGYYFNNTMTMGQILCFIMILCGVVTLYISKKKNLPCAVQAS